VQAKKPAYASKRAVRFWEHLGAEAEALSGCVHGGLARGVPRERTHG